MSNHSEKHWSNNPNAPPTYLTHSAEQSIFAGFLICGILYGVVVTLFFECMNALLNPINRTLRGGVRWGLVLHVAIMFSCVTIFTAITLGGQSVSYIDNREFSGNDDASPGPLGYLFLIFSMPIYAVPAFMLLLNNWLADGLLLYRCHVIYGGNYWVIAFPCLMYICSLAMGIMLVYIASLPSDADDWASATIDSTYSFFSISLALNVLLTSMIVIRIIRCSRNIRNTTGSAASAYGLCKAIAIMLIESSALYVVSFFLYIIPWAVGSNVANIFFPILAEFQVIAPFLIILRIAKQRALTSGAIASGNIGSIHFRSQGSSTGSDETLDGGSTNSVGASGGTREERHAGAENIVNEISLSDGIQNVGDSVLLCRD